MYDLYILGFFMLCLFVILFFIASKADEACGSSSYGFTGSTSFSVIPLFSILFNLPVIFFFLLAVLLSFLFLR